MNYKDRIDRVERSIEESREAAEGAAEKLRAVGVQILSAARLLHRHHIHVPLQHHRSRLFTAC